MVWCGYLGWLSLCDIRKRAIPLWMLSAGGLPVLLGLLRNGWNVSVITALLPGVLILLLSVLTDTVGKADVPFYGVYYGQAALPLPSETLYYVTNDVLDGCTVTNLETGKSYTGTVDFEKETGKDPYEMFLSGASPLIVIENPNAETEKELVVFRDSFGSSMAPLLVSDYRKVTLVDTRYIAPRLIGNFVSFDGADVLFLYSTLVLNQSGTLKD